MPGRCLFVAAHGRLPASLDDGVLAAHRRRLLHRAEGRVLDCSLRWEPDLAAFRHGRVERLTVTGPRPAALRVPSGVPRPDAVPTPTDAAADHDTVVVTFTLCAAPDPVAALGVAASRLGPGGRVLVLEHVRGTGLTGLVQHAAGAVDRTLAIGCRLDLDLAAVARRAGLELIDVARFRIWAAATVPTPCVAAVLRPTVTASRGDP